jgi:hypothetical protein
MILKQLNVDTFYRVSLVIKPGKDFRLFIWKPEIINRIFAIYI